MKHVKTVIIIIWAVILALALPTVMASLEFLEGLVADNIHFKVYPPLLGGERIASFMDLMGDEQYGARSASLVKGVRKNDEYYDIWRYNVNKPVTDASWSRSKDFWQLEIVLAKVSDNLGSNRELSQPVIQIYLDIDGEKSGSSKPLGFLGKMMQFDEKHPWDFLININGKKSFIASYDNSYKQALTAAYNQNNQKIIIRIALNHPLLKKVLALPTTYHYVFTCPGNLTSDKLLRSDWKHNCLKAGQEAEMPQATTIDMLLSKYTVLEENDGTHCMAYPLKVKKKAEKKPAKSLINKYKSLADKEMQEEIEGYRKITRQQKRMNRNKLQLAVAYYNLEEYRKSGMIIDKILSQNGRDAQALSYKAVLTAVKADETSSVSMAFKYIQTSYDQFSRAEKLARNSEEKITVLKLRAEVSLEMPESILPKGREAAADCLKIVKIIKKEEPQNIQMINWAYLNTALGYKKAGMNDLAEIYFYLLKNANGLTYQIKYVLAKNGYFVNN